MKKCPYCGKEYPDSETRCPIDGELLIDLSAPDANAAEKTTTADPPVDQLQSGITEGFLAGRPLTDRRIRVIELTLVCLVAFGSNILTSTYYLFSGTFGNSTLSGLYWLSGILHEATALGLLWYVLLRRSKSFRDLGLKWAWSDLGYSVLLWVGALVLQNSFYHFLQWSGAASETHQTAVGRVAFHLFSGGITPATLLFHILNPVFEELIVRAYVMTEIKALTNSAWKAVVASTLLQTSYHFYQGAPLAVSYAAVFLLFSVYYAKSNRITPVILAHLYTDLLAVLFYQLRH